MAGKPGRPKKNALVELPPAPAGAQIIELPEEAAGSQVLTIDDKMETTTFDEDDFLTRQEAVNALRLARVCISDLEADRDEWKQQHENALASWRTDQENLTKKIAELQTQIKQPEDGVTGIRVKTIKRLMQLIEESIRASNSVAWRREGKSMLAEFNRLLMDKGG